MAQYWAAWLLAVGLWGLGIGTEVWWNLMPRKTVSSVELATVLRRFSQTGVQDFRTLTLADQTGLLYVGAREVLFAFNVETMELQGMISWETPTDKKLECVMKGRSNETECFNYIRFLQPFNTSHLYVCGTFAFQPKCGYIDIATFTLEPTGFEDGRGKCPYDPTKGLAGHLVDGELFTATYNNFLSTEPIIMRSLGQHRPLRTEYMDLWLNVPHFVASAYIQESVGSDTGEEDKFYFFFIERALESSCRSERLLARIARVCKGDLGGNRILQRKWTSFLKARLVCYVAQWQLFFNQIQTVYTLHNTTWQNTIFFGVFRAQWGDVYASAVCEYQLEEVKKVFEGPYKEYNPQSNTWGQYYGPIPSPRPGTCITDSLRQQGYNTSLLLPDNPLNFLKTHTLMDDEVVPRWGRPLLVKKGTNFTCLVADSITGLDGIQYRVLFIGTEEGWLLKAVSLGSWVHMIEELHVFEKEPLENLVLSSSKKVVFASSGTQLVQLPLANCTRHHSCLDCALARDPSCAWNVNTSHCVLAESQSTSLLVQYVSDLDMHALCRFCGCKKSQAPPKNITVVAGTDLMLPCSLSSNLAQPHWTFGGQHLPTKDPDSFIYDTQLRALIVKCIQPSHAGTYQCFSEEQGLKLDAGVYLVNVVATSPSVTLETRFPLEDLGLVWLIAVALGAVSLVLLLLVLSLRRRLREEMQKSAKAAERTMVYPLDVPKASTSQSINPETEEKLWESTSQSQNPTISESTSQSVPPSRSKTDRQSNPVSETDEKAWDRIGSYYYSDGSLKIVPGHAQCQSGGGSRSPPPGIPGQPLPSPTRLHLGGGRNSNANGYVRLQLGGEDRGGHGHSLPELADELRRKLQQRQLLPDSNPEESSV